LHVSIDFFIWNVEELLNGRKLFESRIFCLFQELKVLQKERVIVAGKDNKLPEETLRDKLIVRMQCLKHRHHVCAHKRPYYFLAEIVVNTK
jgi:hypothetical protein